MTIRIIEVTCPHCGCPEANPAGYPNPGCVICCKCSRLFHRNGEPLPRVEYQEAKNETGLTLEEMDALWK